MVVMITDNKQLWAGWAGAGSALWDSIVVNISLMIGLDNILG